MSVNDTNVVDDIGTVPDRNLVVLSAAIAGFTSSAASQFVGTGKFALSSAFEAAAVAAFTAGLTNGISAGLHTAIEGGSFGSALKTAEVQVAARAVKMPQMRLETPRGSWGKVAKRQSPTLSMAQYRVRRLLSRGSVQQISTLSQRTAT